MLNYSKKNAVKSRKYLKHLKKKESHEMKWKNYKIAKIGK